MTRKEIEELATDKLNKSERDELLFFVDELKMEYERYTLMNDICNKIHSIATIGELKQIQTEVDRVYREYIKEWGVLHGTRDNIIATANFLADNFQIDELNHLNSIIFRECLNHAPEYLDLLPYISDSQRKEIKKKEKE